MTILSPTLASVPVFVSWAWEILNSYSSPLLPESDSPFRDASFVILFFFFKPKCSHMAAELLFRSSCPSTQENWSWAQMEPHHWSEGNKLLPEDREEPLAVLWAAVSWAGLSHAPLCFLVSPCYQFTLSSLEQSSWCEFKYYSPFDVDQSQSAIILLLISASIWN